MTAEQAFAEMIGEEGGIAAFGSSPVTGGTAIRGVMRELKAGGMSVVEIIKLLPIIVNLIVELGPQVAEIVAKIRETFAKK